MKKTTCTLYGGNVHVGFYARNTMCMSVFSFIPQGNEKHQLSILII